MVTDELIRKFFRNQCSAEEAKAVSRYLEKYPEELEKYLPASGWDQFREQTLLSADDSERLLGHIQYRAALKKRTNPARNWNQWYKIASVLLMACFIGAWFFRHTVFRQEKFPLADTQTTASEAVEVNNHAAKRVVWLADSTEVTLYPGSRLRYAAGFEHDKRDVRLEGHARFAVAKDQARPFTVYAGGLATTVLGTVFEVTATGEEADTRVSLISGSVLVKADQASGMLHIAPVYLKPGEELQVNRKTSVARTIPVTERGKVDERLANAIPQAGKLVSRGEMVFNDSIASFNHVPVITVLEALQKEYSLSLKYNARVLDKMYFTGSFKRTAGLPDEVIGAIALLNGLKVDQIAHGYQLSK